MKPMGPWSVPQGVHPRGHGHTWMEMSADTVSCSSCPTSRGDPHPFTGALGDEEGPDRDGGGRQPGRATSFLPRDCRVAEFYVMLEIFS